MSEIAEKIRKIYEITRELEEMYPGRHFTPDGHMVGSIGEVIAAEEYGLELFEASHPVHDARAQDGKLVQIKATQGRQDRDRRTPGIPDRAQDQPRRQLRGGLQRPRRHRMESGGQAPEDGPVPCFARQAARRDGGSPGMRQAPSQGMRGADSSCLRSSNPATVRFCRDE